MREVHNDDDDDYDANPNHGLSDDEEEDLTHSPSFADNPISQHMLEYGGSN